MKLTTAIAAAVFTFGYAALASAWPDSAVTCEVCLIEPTTQCTPSEPKWPTSVMLGKPPARVDDHGMNIRLAPNSTVTAIQSGVVAFAGQLGSCGSVVMIRHETGTVSAYGYLSDISVKRGETVQRGGKIGLSGHSHKGQSALYFGMRGGKSMAAQACHQTN